MYVSALASISKSGSAHCLLRNKVIMLESMFEVCSRHVRAMFASRFCRLDVLITRLLHDLLISAFPLPWSLPKYIEVWDSRTGYSLLVHDAQGTLPDGESCCGELTFGK